MAEENDIAQLQLLQQNLQNVLLQKQQHQKQLAEFDSALKEMGNTDQVYRIIGNILVASKKADVEKDIQQKKEILDLRLKSLDKQEKILKQEAEAVQKKVIDSLKKKK